MNANKSRLLTAMYAFISQRPGLDAEAQGGISLGVLYA